jgi:hypothetical protein
MLSSTALTRPGAGANSVASRREFMVPPKIRVASRLEATKQTFNPSEQRTDSHSTSLVFAEGLPATIDRLHRRIEPTRTVAKWGITGPELARLSAAVHFMKLHCHSRRASLWLITTDAGTPRSVIADVWKRITRLQNVFRLPPYSVTTFEGRSGLHAHIIFIGIPEIARRLKASQLFGDLIDVRRVTDHQGLVRKYLVKERTSQAGYGREHILGRRIPGSHRLPGGGDRIRLSRELERDAIEAGYVKPWRHSYAKRSAEERPYRVRRCSSGGERHTPSVGPQ